MVDLATSSEHSGATGSNTPATPPLRTSDAAQESVGKQLTVFPAEVMTGDQVRDRGVLRTVSLDRVHRLPR